jgi:hypothetical protein
MGIHGKVDANANRETDHDQCQPNIHDGGQPETGNIQPADSLSVQAHGWKLEQFDSFGNHRLNIYDNSS